MNVSVAAIINVGCTRNVMRNIMATVKLCIFFSLAILLTNCDGGRTPSKIRLEQNCKVKLPTDFKVLRDEYQDMLQDYCILYDIKLDDKSSSVLIDNIKTSPFYNPNVKHAGMWSDDYYIKVDTLKGVWCKSNLGYDFRREHGLTDYSAYFDTTTNVLKYQECAD